MRNKKIKNIALGGILAAVALVIMFLGGLIPFATYVCPVLCILTGNIYLTICGIKMGSIWYIAVSILSMLLSPDREAAVYYAFLGAYPCIKLVLDKLPICWIWKLLYFNLSAIGAYWVCVYIMGLSEIILEFHELGSIGLAVILLLANITFVMMDRLLSRFKVINKN